MNTVTAAEPGLYAIAYGDYQNVASLNIIHRSKNPADLPLPAKAHLAADQQKELLVLWLPEGGKLVSIGRAMLGSDLKPKFEIEDSEGSHREVWRPLIEPDS